jgi:hypothetical protein
MHSCMACFNVNRNFLIKSIFSNLRCFLFFIALSCYADSTAQIVNPKKAIVKTNSTCKESTEAVFQGGTTEWIRFLNKTLIIDSTAVLNLEFQSRYIACFIVTKKGLLQNISIKPADGAANNIIKVIKLSEGKWNPATCDKLPINSTKTIQITICLSSDQD